MGEGMSILFSRLAARFIAWAKKCRHRTTVDVYKHYFRRFVAEVGDMPAAKMRPFVLTAWAKTWHASQAIVRLYRWAVDEACLLKVNPIERVKHPPKGQRCRIATAAEREALFAAAGPDLSAFLRVLFKTGARPGELRAATWADLYPKVSDKKLRAALSAGRGMIVLRDYKSRKRRRLPNEPRVILLSPRAGRIVGELLGDGPSAHERIFTTAAGRPWTANALRCRMRRLRHALSIERDGRGENIVPYTLRHTFATLATAAGIRDRLLADALGHTETATTARYQHLQVEHVRAALVPFWRKRDRA